nr:MAG TPA: hypothetical protein [Caudoviricetes sp.]
MFYPMLHYGCLLPFAYSPFILSLQVLQHRVIEKGEFLI